MTYRFHPRLTIFYTTCIVHLKIFVVIAMERNVVGQHATHRHIDEAHQPIRVCSLLKLYYYFTVNNSESPSVNITDVKMCNHDMLVVQLTTVEHYQAATGPLLGHLIFDCGGQIYQEKSVNGLF